MPKIIQIIITPSLPVLKEDRLTPFVGEPTGKVYTPDIYGLAEDGSLWFRSVDSDSQWTFVHDSPGDDE